MTLIQRYDFIPDRAANVVAPDGAIEELWVRGDDRILCLHGESGVGKYSEQVSGDPMSVLEQRGYEIIPATELPQPGQDPELTDTYHKLHSPVWRYWITTPDALLDGVREFVAAAEAGGLPDKWAEKAAEDGSATAYTLCSFTLGMDGARSLGSEQKAISLNPDAELPRDTHFFQAVAPIEGFTGVEKESRQPDTLPSQLYEPGELFQTSHPDAADQRSSAFDEADVLDVTGLTLT